MGNTYCYEPLNQKQVNSLHKKFMKGDKHAGFKLAQSVLPLLIDLAQKYYPTFLKRMGIDDFRQEIVLFLVERLSRYDKDKGTITTWAGWELRHFASDKFRKAGSLVHVPACAVRKVETGKIFSDAEFRDLISRDLEPWEYASDNEYQQTIVDFIEELIKVAPVHTKETIHMRHVLGMNLEEIAEHFQLSRQAIDYRCQAAYRAFTQHMRMKGKPNVIGRNARFIRV